MQEPNIARKINEDYNQDDYSRHRHNNNNNSKSKSKNANAANSVIVFLACVFTLALLFAVIYGKVEVTAVYNEISAETKNVEMLQSENVRMKAELDARMSLKSVEEYAENNLGLTKLDKSQINYVRIQSENIVEIPETEKDFFVKVKETFSNIVDIILE